MRVLESRETPGLGDRIQSDADFRARFQGLSVPLASDGARLAHPIEFVRHGARRKPWQVDGITGATVSSQAVTRTVATSAARWVPRIRRHLDDLRLKE